MAYCSSQSASLSRGVQTGQFFGKGWYRTISPQIYEHAVEPGNKIATHDYDEISACAEPMMGTFASMYLRLVHFSQLRA